MAYSTGFCEALHIFNFTTESLQGILGASPRIEYSVHLLYETGVFQNRIPRDPKVVMEKAAQSKENRQYSQIPGAQNALGRVAAGMKAVGAVQGSQCEALMCVNLVWLPRA